MELGQETIPGTPVRDRENDQEALGPYDGFDEMPLGEVWRRGSAGTVLTDHDPYTGEVLARITVADTSDLDEAYHTAERNQRPWSRVRPQERRMLMLRAGRLLELRKEEILDWLIRESGSTRVKATWEWQLTRDGLLEAAGLPLHAEGKLVHSTIPGKSSLIYREPVGVVGVVSPWNFPLHLTMRSVAPALAVGNAVVLKPSSDTPVTGGLLVARIFEEAGLPPGVMSVVIGSGDAIGDAFVNHPVPRVISFTGSTAVGRRVGELAGRQVKRVCLELGGNTPFIVFDDADLDGAVDAAVAGKFLHQGQICLAVNRILVQSRIYDEFQRRFAERARALKVGNPAEPDTAIGPIINRRHLERILRKLEDAVSSGARVALRGEPSGLLLPPAVLVDVDHDMPALKEEVFGPVAFITRFGDEEEAVRQANGTEYGLSSAVFTRDVQKGMRVARRLVAGMTHVNDWSVNDEPHAAFGGEKASGIGRFGGHWAMEEFTTHHWISVQEQPRPYPI